MLAPLSTRPATSLTPVAKSLVALLRVIRLPSPARRSMVRARSGTTKVTSLDVVSLSMAQTTDPKAHSLALTRQLSLRTVLSRHPLATSLVASLRVMSRSSLATRSMRMATSTTRTAMSSERLTCVSTRRVRSVTRTVMFWVASLLVTLVTALASRLMTTAMSSTTMVTRSVRLLSWRTSRKRTRMRPTKRGNVVRIPSWPRRCPPSVRTLFSASSLS